MTHLPTLGACSAPSPFPASTAAALDLGPLSLSAHPERRARLMATRCARGGLSRDAALAFLYQGPRLEVLDARSGERVAAWTFGGGSGGGEDRKASAAAAAAADALSPGKIVSGGLKAGCFGHLWRKRVSYERSNYFSPFSLLPGLEITSVCELLCPCSSSCGGAASSGADGDEDEAAAVAAAARRGARRQEEGEFEGEEEEDEEEEVVEDEDDSLDDNFDARPPVGATVLSQLITCFCSIPTCCQCTIC